MIDFLFFIGAFCLLYIFFNAVNQYRLMRQMAENPDLSAIQKYGGWAVVTGCTDGIGKAYCLDMVTVIDAVF